MSRLIVKNLPKNITEKKLRDLFSQQGTITDIQLKYTSAGKFRQFAFVGYQNEEEAANAINHFNNIFVQTNKICVESCTTLSEASNTKTWSKHTPKTKSQQTPSDDTNANKKSKKTKKDKNCNETAELLLKYKDDADFEEFLELHAPHKKQQLKQFTTEIKGTEDEGANTQEIDNEESTTKTISDKEYMNKLKTNTKLQKTPKNIQLYTLKLKGIPYNCKKKDIKQFFNQVKPFTIRLPVKMHGFAYVGFKTEKEQKKGLLKDKSFLAGKRILVTEYAANNNQDQSNPGNTTKNTKWKTQEESLKDEECIAESGRIFVRNLSYTTTETDIEELFSKFGPLSEVNVPIDPITRKIKGFATITFLLPEHAVQAYGNIDGSICQGRMLHLLPAKSKDSAQSGADDGSGGDQSNYKSKKLKNQKSQATNSYNWNSLFLDQNAVAAIVSEQYGVGKDDILHADNAAIKLSLAETKIVAETRRFLEQEGVKLDAFNGSQLKRSKTVILVKNLPAKTTTSEICQVFKEYGELARVILPPSGITAIVEFSDTSEARKAFTHLAYTKFKNMPLYLEWAPEDSLIKNNNKSSITNLINNDKNSKDPKDQNNDLNTKEQKDEKVEKEDVEAEELDCEPEPDTTLFVKNLNFKTTDESLKKHFEGCGKISYANVATKIDKSNNFAKKLSMGYGFVRFLYKSSADLALKTLQQSVLDGKSLEIKRTERSLANDKPKKSKTSKTTKQTGTKIVVKNLPFQAQVEEVKSLFAAFGDIKAIRMPKKISLESGSHRGFAFIDFTTESAAKSAFEALSQSTHLYGRRLVLEWASNDSSVEELRKRTAAQFKPNDVMKKSKKSVFNVEENKDGL